MTKKKIGIIGAGPGGLMAAMLLSSRNYEVTVFEKSSSVGGRNTRLVKGNYSWDLGPTFLIYKEILEKCFIDAGENISNYLEILSLDPMYKLFFHDKSLTLYSDRTRLKKELERVFPGSSSEFDQFMKKEKKRFSFLKPCLESDFSSWKRYLSWRLIKALPHLGLGKSIIQRLNSSFSSTERSLSFGFQAKYLGMSAWECPSMFSILPYLEHELGVHHVVGGLHKINDAMLSIAKKNKAQIRTNTPVKEILVEKGSAKGVRLEDGTIEKFDELILNADFAYSMTNLFKQSDLKKYKEKKIEKMKFSCSTFMIYLGLNESYSLPFHSVVFAKDYQKNVTEVFEKKVVSKDFSFYVRSPNQLDQTSAPKNQSAMYILVPVPNLQNNKNDWGQLKNKYRDHILTTLEQRLKIRVKDKICEEIIITPQDWHNKYNVHYGATFNLAHNWGQLAMFRPHNVFSDVKNVYLVGGGTHPGSGLPTIYESSRIASRLIEEKYNKGFLQEPVIEKQYNPLPSS